jgi:site-specific DNA recombinase
VRTKDERQVEQRYLCQFPAEYALANRVSHPKNVYLKEADLVG